MDASSAIVVGLGNPGQRYRANRHNLGFRVVERLARAAGVELEGAADSGRDARTVEAQLAGRSVLLAEPCTYMNRSGRAVAALIAGRGTRPEDLVLVFDDADLELGRVRVRLGGGAGGHNGVRSVIETLGSGAFVRVRLGVRGAGRDDGELADYVLEDFAEEELETAEALVRLGADAVTGYLRDGLEPTMNRFNGMRIRPDGPDGPDGDEANDE